MTRPAFDEPVWWTLLTPEDRAAALEDFTERAAIMEHEGGLSRRDAELLAGDLIRARWAERVGMR